MEQLPPYSPHEQQYEDMQYSPDDFEPDTELPFEEFARFFRQRTQLIIEDYQKNGIKPSRYLVEESRFGDQELAHMYKVLSARCESGAMSWGEFRDFLAEREAYWDEKHPLPPLDN